MLDEDEIVTANDYEMNVGYAFDLKTDFSGIEIPDNKKVSVSFEKAQDEQGNDFTSEKEDIYTAVYYVKPLTTDHPTYQINRKLIVKETSGETEISQVSGSDAGDEDSGGEESEEDESETVMSETEFDKAIEEMESQDTYDEETGLSLGEVWNQVIEGGCGSSLHERRGNHYLYGVQQCACTFHFRQRDTRKLVLLCGLRSGNYVTSPFTVKFGDVTATAYCVQPSKPSPGDGVYEITKLSDGKALAKVCYYGTNASKEDGFFDQKHPDFSAGKRFIITHLAASYANGSSDAFYGTNENGKSLAMELYNSCINEPDIPDVHMSFSEDSVTAYVDGNSQRTKSVAFRADEQQTITMNLPKGVKLHNETTGKTSAAGASVTISGGTTFYLSAPLTQAVDVKQSWSSKMRGSIDKDYSAYKITTGTSTQDLALVFGEGVTNEKYVSFSVAWVDLATVSITKKDAATGDHLSGAVYGIYSDAACTKLSVQMPATDAAGFSTVTFAKTQSVYKGPGTIKRK